MNNKIKQNINFLEYPLWKPERKNKTDFVKMTDLEGYIYEASGGIPTKVDMQILYGLMLISQNQKWTQKLTLSKYYILNFCGMPTNQERKQRLRKSLEKWKRVTISFSGTFYDNKEYKIMEFGIINNWHIQKDNNKINIEFNKIWLQKIQNSEYFKYINFNTVKKLKSPMALRLYELLGKTFYNREKWEIDVFKLIKKIPMYELYFSKIVQKIKPAVKRIREQTDLNITVEAVKTGKNQGKFIFRRRATASKQIQQTKAPSPIQQPAASLSIQSTSPTISDKPPKQLKKNIPETKQQVIPQDLIDLIPENFRLSAMVICQQILNKYDKDGLKFYIKYANKQNNLKNYGGLLNSLLKTEPDFYEAFKKSDKKEYLPKNSNIAYNIPTNSPADKLNLKKQEEIKASNIQAYEQIENLKEEELMDLDAFIDKQPLNNFNRKRFNDNKRDLLRLRYFTSFMKKN